MQTSITSEIATSEETVQDPNWERSNSGYFHRLIKIDPGSLKGQSGVFVVWHAGAEPRWVYAGCAEDLAEAFEEIIGNPEILAFEKCGGLYASWSSIRREYQPGIARYLSERLKPLIKNDTAHNTAASPIAVFPPGSRGPAL